MLTTDTCTRQQRKRGPPRVPHTYSAAPNTRHRRSPTVHNCNSPHRRRGRSNCQNPYTPCRSAVPTTPPPYGLSPPPAPPQNPAKPHCKTSSLAQQKVCIHITGCKHVIKHPHHKAISLQLQSIKLKAARQHTAASYTAATAAKP